MEVFFFCESSFAGVCFSRKGLDRMQINAKIISFLILY